MNILLPLASGAWESGSPLGVCAFQRSNLKVEGAAGAEGLSLAWERGEVLRGLRAWRHAGGV